MNDPPAPHPLPEIPEGTYCHAARGHEFHGPYHDREYGFPVEDDDALFERHRHGADQIRPGLRVDAQCDGMTKPVSLAERHKLDRFAHASNAA